MRVFSCARAPWAACGLLSLALSCASTANAADDLVRANLANALRAAWSQHPAAEATERTLAAAQARAVAAAQPLYNPELELSVDDEAEERTASAGLALTLDWSGKRRARAALGQADYTLAEAEAAQRRSNFARQWLQAWAERSSTRERVQLGQQRLDLVQSFAALAERQLAAGDISTLERDLALLARDQAQAEQATLLSDAASAQESFVALGGDWTQASGTGKTGSTSTSTSTSKPTTPMPSDALPPLPDEGFELRMDTVPEARVALAAARSAERRVAVTERERRPDPTLHLRGGRLDLGPLDDNVLGLSVSIPLLVRNTYRAEVSAARAEAGAQAAEQHRIELELRARAERTVRTHAVVREAWAAWMRSPGTDVAQRASLLERLWRAGELSTSDYLIQLKQSLDTSLAGADLRGRLWRSYVDALYATGRLDAWVRFDAETSEVTR